MSNTQWLPKHSLPNIVKIILAALLESISEWSIRIKSLQTYENVLLKNKIIPTKFISFAVKIKMLVKQNRKDKKSNETLDQHARLAHNKCFAISNKLVATVNYQIKIRDIGQTKRILCTGWSLMHIWRWSAQERQTECSLQLMYRFPAKKCSPSKQVWRASAK